jgi:sigma-54 dependent transcriptional regulator, acetoin dehydrogenase operon transcriptional activator AcoR
VKDSNTVHHADRVNRLVSNDLTPTTAPHMAPGVDQSWRRCLNDFKLDPACEYGPTVLDGTRLKSLQAEHEELVQIARAEMDSLYEQISGSGYALLLADTSGVILCEKIDPVLKRMFVSAGLVIGAEWSEQREGTNGIGTCATEARPITIHQSDHFRSRHVGLSCSAAPIHDQYGKIVAVLDASCVNASGTRESQMHTVALVNTSARLIEKCLFLRRHQTDSMLRFHPRPEFVDLLHDGAIAVAADGTIVATDMTGLKLLGAESRNELVGRSIADVFDISYEELLATFKSGRRAIWELRDNLHGRRYFASLVGGQHSLRNSAPLAAPARALVHVARSDAPGTLTLQDLAGQDPKMLRNARNAQRVADRNVSIVIRGPTGSGKEAFAKALHLASSRAKQPFIAVNCAAIPESLIESELFGYSPGAFTGARREGMRGRIVQSSGGTLFLDEIGDMPVLLQTRLLRVLEEQEVMPLGCETPVKVDLRVICASHRNLHELLARGEFREDLYYRLNGITLDLPPLAERRDKEALIRKCIARESGGSDDAAIEMAALQRLLDYGWPGNIRELRNTIRASLALGENGIIRVSDLPEEIRNTAARTRECSHAEQRANDAAPQITFASAERDALLRVIEQHRWVMSHVASHFGISRNTLYRKIKRHGIPLSRPARH